MFDRGEVTVNLLEQEFELQINKIEVVQSLLEAYEHQCDPLESIRILQIIVDTMALRPRISLEGTYFRDSYQSEISLLKEKQGLYHDVIQF